ncbi:MAG: energy transducer TonB, partial [Chthoniobacteraceae bacterium]|nr:energy transducer TonB [Chthoniobacteraceae bacterium]
GWYSNMLQDRFTSHWDQPLSLLQNDYATLITIKIDRNGRILNVSLAQSSGNPTMDESVMTAAKRVTQVEPLPKGLGDAGGYEVNIEFKLHP